MSYVRQFRLLLWKNLLLLTRNKVWTFFELILPFIFTLPIVYLIVKNQNVTPTPPLSFAPVRISAGTDDLSLRVGTISSITTSWCPVKVYALAYSSNESPTDVTALMDRLAQQYNTGDRFRVEPVRFDKELEMIQTLRLELGGENSSSHCFPAKAKRYVGGVVFKQFDVTGGVLDYQLLLPSRPDERWRFDEQWDDPFTFLAEGISPRLPKNPPYWASGFTTLQVAIDSIFVQLSTNTPPVELFAQRVPEQGYIVNSVAMFIQFLPALWALCAFLTVIHTARDVAHEKATTKEFLSVMGLSTPMFYLSHVVFAWCKCAIVLFTCAIILSSVLTSVSVTLFLFTVGVFGIACVVFACLIASMFKNTNTTLKVAIVAWVLACGLCIKAPKPDHVLTAFLFSLDFHTAFYYCALAIGDYMNKGRPLTWLNMFEGGSLQFTMGGALLMLIFDVIWMSVLTLCFEECLRNSEFSFSTLFSPPPASVDDHPDGAANESVEVDSGLQNTNAGIKVDHLVKVWNETGERAVDGITFKAYQGQVTVLLGHNGAGKSTTFSVISGLVEATHGQVCINNYDLKTHRGEARQSIGLCPQANCLFDKLTVWEHLHLIAGLKGVGGYEHEANKLTSALKLGEKRDEYAMNLSGGMKRKLCVSMALIGESKVVLLDEPTAGMDPGARRDVENLLVAEKPHRTILLTTHYMDEAEVLGDRVVIMGKGRVHCDGSPDFLKKRYGTGYVLSIVFNEGVKIEKMKSIIEEMAVRKGVKGATFGKEHAKQLEVTLPKDQVRSFPDFYEELESSTSKLGIASFGTSLNSLEQIFLKVGELADPSESLHYADDDNGISLNEQVINSQKDSKRKGLALGSRRLLAILRKRFLYSRRNAMQLVTQLVVPLLILGLVAALSRMNLSFSGEDMKLAITPSAVGASRVPVQVNVLSAVAEAYLRPSLQASQLLTLQYNKGHNITKEIINYPKELPATGYGAIFGDNNTILALFNVKAYHSLPVSLNLISNARLRAEKKQGSIRTTLMIYKSASDEEELTRVPSEAIDTLLGPLMVLSLALLTSTFVMFLVEERVSKFAHQQVLTGISPILFWGGSILYDLIYYCLACACFLIMFLVFDFMHGYIPIVLLLWLLYFWACMPFIYAVAYLFSSPSKANVLLVIWQIVAAFSAMVFIGIVSIIPAIDPKITSLVRDVLLTVLPSFALGNALMTVSRISTLSPEQQPPNLWEWEQIGKNVTFMLIFGFVSAFIFVLLQFKSVRYQIFRLWDWRCRRDYQPLNTEVEEDCDVARERISVQQSSASGTNLLALEVQNLSKRYGSLTAVSNLTFGIQNRECFGLLGVNGAGKTTTFDILTGESFATSGEAKIDGRPVTEQISIGYCPQFDAMMMDLTGREMLEILAALHGFKDVRKKANLVLDAVGMSGLGDKLARHYSGGQKRKVSVGMAMISATRIVILDEPTAGIDPKARRDIWGVLSAIRDHSQSALLLTSHSMDECEALCSRIAILQRGKMIAVGSSQWLKSRFGNKFSLSITVPTLELRQTVIDQIAADFPNSTMKTHVSSTSLNIRWQLERRSDDCWSSLFRQVIKTCDALGVQEFCLAQSSLEETFLRLAVEDDGGEDQPAARRSATTSTTDSTSHPTHLTVPPSR